MLQILSIKKILPFTGVRKGLSGNGGNFEGLLDFEKNINKYTVAVDENDKVVLIDKNGKTSDVNANIGMTDSALDYGRVLSLYQDKNIYKKTKKVKKI